MSCKSGRAALNIDSAKDLKWPCLEICYYSGVVSQGVLTGKKTTFLVLYSYRIPTRHAQDLPGPCIGASLQLSSKHSTPGQIMTNLASYKTSARINRNQQEATSKCLLGSLTASGHGLFQRPLFLDLAAGPYIGSVGLQHCFRLNSVNTYHPQPKIGTIVLHTIYTETNKR